ncbi:hypothetical protein M0804_007793 [Polistes exclamans]|nr:hypothetical protein M0804_007793 [Polistes exclamans]
MVPLFFSLVGWLVGRLVGGLVVFSLVKDHETVSVREIARDRKDKRQRPGRRQGRHEKGGEREGGGRGKGRGGGGGGGGGGKWYSLCNTLASLSSYPRCPHYHWW